VFSFGGQELLIIVVIALLLFGPDKIPQLARTIGRFTKEFNKYKDIMESTIRMEISNAEGPTKDELTIEERITKAAGASTALIENAASAEAEGAGGSDEAAAPGEPASTPAPACPPTGRAVASADESDEEGEE
jgi:TatA/E family protein of Tat protein translocase